MDNKQIEALVQIAKNRERHIGMEKRTRDILINSGPGIASGRVRSRYTPHVGKKHQHKLDIRLLNAIKA